MAEQLKLAFTYTKSHRITVQAAARLSGYDACTIRAWCKRELFTTWRPFGRWEIDRESFLAFLEASRRDPVDAKFVRRGPDSDR
jgi:hypothetical protein